MTADLDDLTFPDVLDRARRGHPDAWANLYDHFTPQLRGYLHANRAPEPDDTLGQIWVEVVRDLDQFDGDLDDMRRWLVTIARHRTIDRRRFWRRRPQTTVDPTSHTGQQTLDQPDGTDTPDVQAADRLQTRLVLQILDQLTASQRDVLTLRILGGMTIGEIAEVTGRRPNQIKALQRRGIVAIRRAAAVPGSAAATLVAEQGASTDD